MKSRLFVAVALLSLSACSVTTVRQHPDFAARRSAIQSVGVVPPEATFRLITFTGDDQPIPASQDYVKAELPKLLAAELGGKGFQIRDSKLIEGQLAELPDLRFQTTQLQQNFAQAAKEMYAGTLEMPTTRAESYRRSLGAQVTQVSDPVEADALILARVEGFEKSGGEIAKDFAKTLVVGVLTGAVVVQPTQGAVISMAFVDGTTGDILWANAAGTQGDIKSVLPALVKQVLTQLPARSHTGTIPATQAAAPAVSVPVAALAAPTAGAPAVAAAEPAFVPPGSARSVLQ